MSADTASLAESWVDYWSEKFRTGTFPPNSHAGSKAYELVCESPEATWSFIVEVLRLIEAKPDSPLFQVLAAGPVENLLNHYGALMIDRVEVRAREDSAFQLLLGGVWSGGMSPEIWSRVEKCRRQTW